MNLFSKATFLFLSLIFLFSCNKEWKGDGELEKEKIVVDGFTRRYRVYTPASYDPSNEYPLVFVLHGRFGKGKGTDKFTSMNPLADEKQVILCYPDGYKKSWADDRNSSPAFQEGVNDINFFNALIDQLILDYSIDEQRIYSCGMSNGGFMSISLACHMSDRIAAVAAVTGCMAPDPMSYCPTASPIGVMLIGGVDDPISPYDGGIITESENSASVGFPATFEHWRDLNGCVDPVHDSIWVDMDPNDGTTVIVHSHTSCDSSVKVMLYEVNGMGHTWPQGTQYLKEERIGKVSQEFHGSTYILDFLLEHTLD